jgi:NADPH:quinone reductase-like Zn-dependent oxidoreductase
MAMRAVQVAEFGPPEVLRVADVDEPHAGPGQVRVVVRAAGVNPVDWKIRSGAMQQFVPIRLPYIPGSDVAGVVDEVGPGLDGVAVGDEVFGFAVGGGYAEYAVLAQFAARPAGMSWPEAGGLPVVTETAVRALDLLGVAAGQTLLINGAAGGVGTAAVQLGAAAGAHVTATVRRPEAREAVTALGANEVLEPDGFEEHGPFDVILELVGAPNLGPNLKAVATQGRIVVIGIGAGAKGELNLRDLMTKRAAIRASTLRARPLEEKALTARAMERHVLPLFDTGALRVPVAETFPLERAVEGYDRFAEGGKIGKIVLMTDGG